MDTDGTGQIALDGRVLIFVLAISMITGLGFGLLPALNASQSGWHAAMKEGGRTTAGVRRRRLRNSLVVCEVALALVLLIGAGLMLRSFHRLMQVDCGFDPSSVLTFRMSIPFSAYTDPVPRARLYNEVVERLESLPGVKSAGAAAILPLRGTMIGLTFEILGRPAPPPGEEPVVRSNSVTVDYFRTMGMALQRGRFFTELDTRDAPAVTIINETMVRQFWPDEDPIGQRIAPAVVLGDHDPDSYEIVGIVADVRANAVDVAARPCMYIPNEQQTWPFMTFAVRTTVDPSTLIGAVRGEIASVTKDEAAFDFKTMEQYTSEAVGDRRFPMFLLGLFAVLALILAAMGMYATLSYSVAQRTHEIGVRVAIGAQRSDVLRLIVKQGLVLTISGLGIGLLASLALARVLSSQLYEIGAADPVTFAGVSLLLTAVALLACYIPARRATKVDPMVALRCE